MVDYTYYQTVYLGSAISEKSFPGLVAQAEARLQQLRRWCKVVSYGEESEKFALCAMAEAIFEHSRRGGVKNTSLGGVSVSYEDRVSLSRAVYNAASVYLDIYRGTGSAH